MDVLPTGEQEDLLLGHDAHGAANLAGAHVCGRSPAGSRYLQSRHVRVG
jgi:hypothetical protein